MVRAHALQLVPLPMWETLTLPHLNGLLAAQPQLARPWKFLSERRAMEAKLDAPHPLSRQERSFIRMLAMAGGQADVEMDEADANKTTRVEVRRGVRRATTLRRSMINSRVRSRYRTSDARPSPRLSHTVSSASTSSSVPNSFRMRDVRYEESTLSTSCTQRQTSPRRTRSMTTRRAGDQPR
jgi:hypothetical protein